MFGNFWGNLSEMHHGDVQETTFGMDEHNTEVHDKHSVGSRRTVSERSDHGRELPGWHNHLELFEEGEKTEEDTISSLYQDAYWKKYCGAN